MVSIYGLLFLAPESFYPYSHSVFRMVFLVPVLFHSRILVLVLFRILILVRSRALRNIESKLSSEVSFHLHEVCKIKFKWHLQV